MKTRDEKFAEILKSVMETEVPPEISNSAESIDCLVMEGFIEEHGNRKFHVTEAGALLYGEIFLRLKYSKQ